MLSLSFIGLKIIIFLFISVQVFIEDSIGDRVWVDLEQCRKLVENICIIFQTKTSSGQPSGESSSSAKSSAGDSAGQTGQTGSSSGGGGGGGEKEEGGGLVLDDVDVEPRYVTLFEDNQSLLHAFHSSSSPLSLLYSSPLSFSLVTSKSLKTHILQLVSEALSRHTHPPDSVSRNLLRFLAAVAGYPEVRVSVALKIESWIQNPKVQQFAIAL